MVQQFYKNKLKILVNYLLPPKCLKCHTMISQAHRLCHTCWQQLTFISDPRCKYCGWPLPYTDTVLTCLDCQQRPPVYNQSLSVFHYDGVIRDLIIRFKHNDATYLAPALAWWLATATKGILNKADYLIPVPLHRWRLLKRCYNQATLLAHNLTKLSGKPTLKNVLRRQTNTSPQYHKTRQQRNQNVQGAFIVPFHKSRQISNKTIVLIDDVWTTGATIKACCRALKKAGVKEIIVLTLARVVHVN